MANARREEDVLGRGVLIDAGDVRYGSEAAMPKSCRSIVINTHSAHKASFRSGLLRSRESWPDRTPIRPEITSRANAYKGPSIEEFMADPYRALAHFSPADRWASFSSSREPIGAN